MRTAIKLLILLLMMGYLIFAVVKFATHEDTAQCKSVNIVIADSTKATLITAEDVEKMLRKYNLHPLGRSIKDIKQIDIEQRLSADPFIKKALCTVTPGENVQIFVAQRLPLLRIMAENGDDYYIDDKGYRMAARGYEADLAVVTGHVTEQFAKKHLTHFGLLLRDDPFWNAQIAQIHVQPNSDLDLAVRVGNQIVHLGKAENIERKLRNLRAFYDKVLPNVGWHKYKEISVAYENQVIGIK
ncbi:MAG: cell division protein FtsQ [Bacteroidaceae bacterium]|nr:cell division protein FtsQ [Bacteroidaceae bacterium]